MLIIYATRISQRDYSVAQKELMRSIEIYREYLRNRDCLANTKEIELQKIIDNVIEEQYQKVNETRRREQAQRRQLFCVSTRFPSLPRSESSKRFRLFILYRLYPLVK